MSNIYIRNATIYDLFQLQVLMEEGLREAKGLLPPYDLLQAAHATLDLAAKGLIFVAAEKLDESRERVVGALMLDTRTWHWNPHVKYLETIHFYVSQDYRSKSIEDGRPIAVGLLEAARGLAERLTDSAAQPWPLLVGTIFAPDRISSKAELIERSGIAQVGTYHLYVPDVVATKEAAQ